MKTTESLTDERGKNYGHPVEQFECAERMMTVWRVRRSKANGSTFPKTLTLKQEHGVRHAVHMILTKLSRSANNPMHKDDWDDIQGYARCAKMVLGLEK